MAPRQEDYDIEEQTLKVQLGVVVFVAVLLVAWWSFGRQPCLSPERFSQTAWGQASWALDHCPAKLWWQP